MARKYSILKRSQNVKLPSYKLITQFRREISLTIEIAIVKGYEGYSIGTFLPYHFILTNTIERNFATLDPICASQFPLSVQISDGMDGFSSHRIYNQVNFHPDLSTKALSSLDSKF